MKVKFGNSIASLPHFKARITQQTLSFEVMKQNFKGKTTHKNFMEFCGFRCGKKL